MNIVQNKKIEQSNFQDFPILTPILIDYFTGVKLEATSLLI